MEFWNWVLGIFTILVVFGGVYCLVAVIRTTRLRTRIDNALKRIEALEAQFADKSLENRLEDLETIVVDLRKK